MAKKKMPGQWGGEQPPQTDRERASHQPGQQSPGQKPEPKERASTPDMNEHDAARTQQRQDPLQKRDR